LRNNIYTLKKLLPQKITHGSAIAGDVVVRVTRSSTLKYWKQILSTDMQKVVFH